jgi:ADP-ribosylglycohydrolase
MSITHAIKSLLALSVGDAFGENELRIVPPEMGGPDRYPWTDDTAMAISIVRCLAEDGRIIQDKLAGYFAERFQADPQRGYGRGTASLLEGIFQSGEWQRLSANWWGEGIGSFGNGAAMRVAPLGAFFKDIPTVVEEARLSAQVTHDHPEAIAGAIGVAVAASLATHGVWSWDTIIGSIPPSAVRDKTLHASKMRGVSHGMVAGAVGNGSEVSAADTVPFCLWAAHQALVRNDFAISMSQIVEVGGDTDTNCAIVAGIIGNRVTVPQEWLDRTEKFNV